MFKRSASKNKMRILFVDEKNDLQSQIAEYFVREIFGDLYDVYSAGPSPDYVDCELISVMYQLTYDIRSSKSKDLNDEDIPESYDQVLFLEKATYDRIKDVIPWDAPQILQDFGRKDNFEEATDDVELLECFKAFIERIRVWVEETFADPEKLKSMVV